MPMPPEFLRTIGFGSAKGADPSEAARLSWESPKRKIPDVLEAVYSQLRDGEELEAVAAGIVKALKSGSPELFKQLVERKHGKVPDVVEAEVSVPQLILRDRTKTDAALPEAPKALEAPESPSPGPEPEEAIPSPKEHQD